MVGPQTSSYFTGSNPLYAALGVYYASVTQGYAYTVVNTIGTGTGTGGTATTLGQACSVTTNRTTYTGSALDTIGAAMSKTITTNNLGVTPQPGFIYRLAGGGVTTLSSTPTLGTNTIVSDSTLTKLVVSPLGDVYIGDFSKVLFCDINTGYIRLLFAAGTNVVAGSYCTGASGQTSLSAYSDACPAAKSLFSNNNGPGVAVDGPGNLYLYDASSNTSGMFVRKVLAQGLAVQVVVASPSCLQNADLSVDCTVALTATPSSAGARSTALSFSLPSGTWTNSLADIALGGTATGSVLALDSASTTNTGVTTAVSPHHQH